MRNAIDARNARPGHENEALGKAPSRGKVKEYRS
nr:MAG TPA: hypothetical protein [Caudoviricetes sp.]